MSAGNWASDNNFQMNGVGVNDIQQSGYFSAGVAIPNPDTIQEFKVQTGQYDASYGRNAGANVDVVTKGGTNQYHGAAWEYFRNDALNANTFFLNSVGAPARNSSRTSSAAISVVPLKETSSSSLPPTKARASVTALTSTVPPV